MLIVIRHHVHSSFPQTFSRVAHLTWSGPGQSFRYHAKVVTTGEFVVTLNLDYYGHTPAAANKTEDNDVERVQADITRACISSTPNLSIGPKWRLLTIDQLRTKSTPLNLDELESDGRDAVAWDLAKDLSEQLQGHPSQKTFMQSQVADTRNFLFGHEKWLIAYLSATAGDRPILPGAVHYNAMIQFVRQHSLLSYRNQRMEYVSDGCLDMLGQPCNWHRSHPFWRGPPVPRTPPPVPNRQNPGAFCYIRNTEDAFNLDAHIVPHQLMLPEVLLSAWEGRWQYKIADTFNPVRVFDIFIDENVVELGLVTKSNGSRVHRSAARYWHGTA